MRNRKTQGFTLIELLIVIAIIGILAAVLIPNLLNARARANDVAAQSVARQVATAAAAVQVNNPANAVATCGAVTNATVTVTSGSETAVVPAPLPVSAVTCVQGANAGDPLVVTVTYSGGTQTTQVVTMQQ